MLSYFLAIIIAIISVALYLTAFLDRKIHRQDDFLWSGLGLFYGLILWICAGRITGALLLGQLAATFLIIAFVWETRQLRKAITSQENEVQLEGISLFNLILSLLGKLSSLTQRKTTQTKATSDEQKVTTKQTPEATSDLADSVNEKEEEQSILEETTPVDQKEQSKISTENTVTSQEEITTPESIDTSSETSKIDNQPVDDSSIDNDQNKETESETKTQSNSVNLNKTFSTEENKDKGLFAKLLNNLKKPFQKKSSPPSQKAEESNVEDDDFTIKSESKVPISSPENISDLEGIKPDQDKNEIEEETDLELYFEVESDTLTTESADATSDLDTELEESQVESTSSSPSAETELSEDLDLDDISEETPAKVETPVENENLSSPEIPAEDKINLLTDLIDEKSESTQSTQENDLKDLAAESDLDLEKEENEQNSSHE